jgi:hypothetical protein
MTSTRNLRQRPSHNVRTPKSSLPYDPGRLPTKPAPLPGESVTFKVKVLPPRKDYSRSIRNPSHPQYALFVALRKAATQAMRGRAWFRGSVFVDLEIYAPRSEIRGPLADYSGGVLDTLDGSHGYHFTYLPIVFEDDHWAGGSYRFKESSTTWYRVRVSFVKNLPRSQGSV